MMLKKQHLLRAGATFNVGKTALRDDLWSPMVEVLLPNSSFVVRITFGHIDDLDKMGADLLDRSEVCDIVQIDRDDDLIH